MFVILQYWGYEVNIISGNNNVETPQLYWYWGNNISNNTQAKFEITYKTTIN